MLLAAARAPSARAPLLHLAHQNGALEDMPPRAPAIANALVVAALRDLRGWAAQVSSPDPGKRVATAFCLLPTTGVAESLLGIAHAFYEEHQAGEDSAWKAAGEALGATCAQEGAVLVGLYIATMRLLSTYVADADEALPDDLPEAERAAEAMRVGAATMRAKAGWLTRVRGSWERDLPAPYLHPKFARDK